jgi:phage gp29-like protein
MAKSSKQPKEQGISGVQINNGVIMGEDYNPKLNGPQALRVWDEMSSSDATVNAALEAIKLPIKSAQFDLDPASDDQADKDVAAFVDDCLFRQIDWAQFLDEALTYLEYGHDFHEMVLEAKDVLGVPRIGLAKLAYRKQTTIVKVTMTNGDPGIEQLGPDGKSYDIPESVLVRFTNKQRGDNVKGVSILRTAYKHWYIKDRLYRIDAVGHERQALGIVDIAYPVGAKTDDRKRLRRAAKNMRSSESSYIEHPIGYEVGFMDMKGGTLRDVMPSISHHDRQIMKNVLAQFLEIGAQGSSGTRNVSEDQSRLFQKSVEAVASRIAYVLQNTVVKTLVDMNFNGRAYPTLRVAGLSDENVPVISDAVQKFVSAGVLHPTGSDENSTRRMINWAELSEDEIKDIDYSPKPVAPSPPAAVQVVAPDKVDASVLRTAKQLRAALTDNLYGPQEAA